MNWLRFSAFARALSKSNIPTTYFTILICDINLVLFCCERRNTVLLSLFCWGWAEKNRQQQGLNSFHVCGPIYYHTLCQHKREYYKRVTITQSAFGLLVYIYSIY